MTLRVALLDSGVDAQHPHLAGAGKITIGPRLTEDGSLEDVSEQTDSLGHGTAAAAAILDLAPGIELVSIQVFGAAGACPFEHVLVALEHALELQVDLVNLSLGTTRRAWRERLTPLVARASQLGTRIVAPAAHHGLPSLPGCLAGVHGVLMDANLAREAPEHRELEEHDCWYASPYPRDLPGLPRDANLAGVSMAAANLTGFLARLRAC